MNCKVVRVTFHTIATHVEQANKFHTESEQRDKLTKQCNIYAEVHISQCFDHVVSFRLLLRVGAEPSVTYVWGRTITRRMPHASIELLHPFIYHRIAHTIADPYHPGQVRVPSVVP